MNKTLADILRSYIPDGDGYNSEYAHNLNAAADALESQQSAPAGYVLVKAGVEGVQFGNAWYSHEKITGYSADQLNSGHCGVTGRAYMDWLAAAPKAEQPAHDVASVPDGLPLVIAGALFDFGGYLTTREKVIEVGATANASPMVDLIKEFADMRGLSLTDAAVLSWSELLPLAAAPQPAADCGLEVVAWRIGFPHSDGYKVYAQHQPWAYEKYGTPPFVTYEVQDLVRKSDADARIAELEAENARVRQQNENQFEMIKRYQAELYALKAPEGK